MDSPRELRFASTTTLVVLSIAASILLRTAWMSDDAAITARSVLNLLNGFGPTFNIDERVQGFTHPLWFLLVAAVTWPSGNVELASVLLGLSLSLVTIWLLLGRLATSRTGGLLAVGTLLLSRAFVDYSTSGLENSLSHLLIVIMVWSGSRFVETREPRAATISLGALGLLYLSRQDLVLLAAPFAVYVLRRCDWKWRELARPLLAAAVPVCLWTLFAVVYYGFPFPNTAYAKLTTGLPVSVLVSKGLWYLAYSAGLDPLTPAVICLALVLALQRTSESRAMASGTMLYLLYVVWIGGDFMAGRFLSAPLVFSAITLARIDWRREELVATASLIVLLGSSNLTTTILASMDAPSRRVFWGDVADERLYYFDRRGLLTAHKEFFARKEWVLKKRSVRITCGGLGLAGLRAGPGTHFVDECALTDPLLARLPAKMQPVPRSGHYFRRLPAGYLESLENDENLLVDPPMRAYYDQLRRVIRGPLFRAGRFREILALNLGGSPVPERDDGRGAELGAETLVPIESLQNLVAIGSEWNAPGNRIFSEEIVVDLDKPERVRRIELALDGNDTYLVEAFQNGDWRLVGYVGPTRGVEGMMVYSLELPSERTETRKFRIVAKSGDDNHSLGHFLTSN